MRPRIFLLSPARLDGERARLLFHPATMFPLARALHSGGGATLGEVFSFLSGLYFRGKLAYAETFARAPKKLKSGIFIITTNRGLLTPSTRVSLDDLAGLSESEIDHSSEQFRILLQRDAQSVTRSGRAVRPFYWAASQARNILTCCSLSSMSSFFSLRSLSVEET